MKKTIIAVTYEGDTSRVTPVATKEGFWTAQGFLADVEDELIFKGCYSDPARIYDGFRNAVCHLKDIPGTQSERLWDVYYFMNRAMKRGDMLPWNIIENVVLDFLESSVLFHDEY